MLIFKKNAYRAKKIIYIAVIFITVFIDFPCEIYNTDFPEYRVVIDPGHGGLSLTPKKLHGDRFDSISGNYIDYYAYGVRFGNIIEHEIVYSIAAKVKNLLDLCRPGGDFHAFSKIVRRFTDDDIQKIVIITELSRPKADKTELEKSHDPNADFRLFDYPDRNGDIKPGRMSRINAFKPHLVVSLHCDFRAPVYFRGINPVITAPYSFLSRGLEYIKGKEKSRDFFFSSPYRDWFTESVKRTGFKWFLNDVSVYFTGFPVDNSLEVKYDKFLGYRQNMVEWRYKDNAWENYAKKHPPNTLYSGSPLDFIQAGKFWEREKSIYEAYRRDGGPEGFGGDNLYASSELIRYILFSLYQEGSDHRSQRPGRPYISVWSLPLLVNAISAYIELGYLHSRRDRFLLTEKQDEIAEGIAAGIYSLFTGVEIKKKEYKYLPRGKRIDLLKYRMSNGVSYFDSVIE